MQPCTTYHKRENLSEGVLSSFGMHLKESYFNLQMVLCLPAFLPSGLPVFISTRVLGKLESTPQSQSVKFGAGSREQWEASLGVPGMCASLSTHSWLANPFLIVINGIPKKQNPPFVHSARAKEATKYYEYSLLHLTLRCQPIVRIIIA